MLSRDSSPLRIDTQAAIRIYHYLQYKAKEEGSVTEEDLKTIKKKICELFSYC